jgi:polyisoprenoid-binding protein YceI
MLIRYRLNPVRSRFTVQAFAAGMLSALAHSPTFSVRDFNGELQLDSDNPATATLHMDVKAKELELVDRVKPQDRAEIESRMREEVLNVAAHPEIRFTGAVTSAIKIADNWYRLEIKGDLSVRGAKGTQRIDAQLRIFDGEVHLSGEFSIHQSAYGIKRVSAVGGTIYLKDDLKCSFDIIGRQEGV